MKNNAVEQNKNKNLIIWVMTCILVLLITSLVYFIFINKEENKKYEDNAEYKLENFDEYINKLKEDGLIKNVKYEFHEIIQNYEYKQLDGRDDISIKLSQNKKINLLYDDESNIIISNVSDVKDYVDVLHGDYVYIITNNGSVYKYSTNDEEYKDKAIKLINIKDANKFVYISYELKKGLYSSTILGVVDQNNNYIELADITSL